MTLLLLVLAGAGAQTPPDSRPVVPSAGLAAENGPGTLWVNPANLAYDPDPRWGLFVGSDLVGSGTSIAATAGVGGLSLGVHHLLDPDGAADWSLDYASSLRLPQRLALGWRASWHLLEGANNFVAWDLGASWRPLPWLGASVVARNIGSPDPSAPARTGGGIALRPFGDLLVVGADTLMAVPTDDPQVSDELYQVTARVRPTEGLYFRGSFDSRRTLTLGIEAYFGGGGGGFAAVQDQRRLGTIGWLGSDQPGESLVRAGRQVASLDLLDAPPYQPATGLFASPTESWLEILELLRRAEEDPAIQGLSITLGRPSLSWGRLQELRDRIATLEAIDKPVTVVLRGQPDTAAYYVASAASRILLHPASGLDLVGLSLGTTHVRGTLDLLGVEAEFVRRAEYKSAVETFTETGPSPEAREQLEALLDDLEAEVTAAIAAGRGLSEEVVRGWIDGGPWPARAAHDRGMVDALAYEDEIEDHLQDLHQGPVRVTDLVATPQPRSAWESPSQIAVLYVDSVIVAGPSSPGGLFGARTTGSETLVEQLDRARTTPLVRAVVLRVDSPGGSSFASDEIWRAVQRVQEAGKPVVVSFGGVAASGGYYVAAGADAIWAEPTTITGSIGVYSLKVAAGRMLERIGVTSETLTRGRNADIHSPLEPWDPVQRDRMQAQVDAVYEDFKDRVREGRGMTEAEVEEVSRGRVWSGRRALEVGLVDGLGGFEEAIADARARAGIPSQRRVALVSYSPRGLLTETLGPALVTAGLARPPGATIPTEVEEALRPLALWSVLDEGPLLLDPTWLGVAPP